MKPITRARFLAATAAFFMAAASAAWARVRGYGRGAYGSMRYGKG